MTLLIVRLEYSAPMMGSLALYDDDERVRWVACFALLSAGSC